LLSAYPDVVTLLTKKVPGWQEFDRHESSERFRIIRRFQPLPNWRYEQLPKALPQFLHAGGIMFAGKYDCLHCGDLFPQGLNGVFLRRIFNVPLLVFCHGEEITQIDSRRYQPKVRDFIFHHADAVIAANQFACDGLARIGIDSSRVHKITPGVNREEFHPKPPSLALIQEHKLSGKKVILTVSRLVPRKGHKAVLQALPIVQRQVKDLVYLIAGEGPERSHLEEMAKELGISDSVIFLGSVMQERLTEYYSLCDVFVMTNRMESGGDAEGFGMVFTEANAMGKPVIGGRSGGAAEAIVEGQTGFLVDPDNSDEIARRLCLLLMNDQFAREMGAKGQRRVEEEFNWESRGNALRKITEDLVRASRSGILRRSSSRESSRPDSVA